MNVKYRKGKRHPETYPLQQKKEKKVTSNKEKETKIKISGWRLCLFRLISLTVVPILLILTLEFGLRLTGYGYDAKAIIKYEIKGQKVYCDNVKFGWLFFPPNIAREFSPFVFPLKKTENTYRIFIFGSSSARGEPDCAYSFSRILEIMLSEQYPGVNFEIINMAMTAINSHVVVKIVKDCAQYKPDLFVIYMGNNEVNGPYGAGTVFAPLSDNLTLIQAGIAFRGTKLGQMLTNISYATGWRKVPKAWGGLGMFLDKQVSADDERLQIVYKNYSRNLETIIKTAQKRRISVILTTVASNLKDCPPFASLHRKSLAEKDKNKFEMLYKEAAESDMRGQYSGAIEKYLAAADIDGQFAELQFRLGRCYFLLGRYDEAKQRYIKARELDTIRLRADNRINEIIKQTAQNKGSESVYFADAVNALDEQSPHKIPDSELFYDHVHLNFKGNFILARSVFDQIEKTLPDRIKNQKLAGQERIGENQFMQALAYSDWDKCRLTQIMLNDYFKRPPFTNQLYHDEQVKSLERQVDSLKNKLSKQVLSQISTDYRRAIEKRPADWILHWKYGSFLTDAIEDYRAAEVEFKKVLEFVPQCYWAHGLLGNLYGPMGNYDEGLSRLNEAKRIRPYFADIYYDIGLFYQVKKMTKEAEKNYKEAIRLDPEHYPSYINLGLVLAYDGRIKEAIQVCRNGLKFLPDSEDLHKNLGIFLSENGQRDEAVKEFRTVLKINPDNALAKQLLENTERALRTGK